MFGFSKKIFIELLKVYTIVRFVRSLDSNYKEPVKCVSLTHRPCQTISTLFNINSNKTIF